MTIVVVAVIRNLTGIVSFDSLFVASTGSESLVSEASKAKGVSTTVKIAKSTYNIIDTSVIS